MLQTAPKFFIKVQNINENGSPDFKTIASTLYRSLKLQEFLQLR
jgi:hypothetical protein